MDVDTGPITQRLAPYLPAGWESDNGRVAEGASTTVFFVKRGTQRGVVKFAQREKLLKTWKVASSVVGKQGLEQTLPGLSRKPTTTTSGLLVKAAEGVALYDISPTREQGVVVAVQLATALDALHMAGWSHNDLHGDNILVDPNSGAVCIIDYDLCTPNSFPHFTEDFVPRDLARLLSLKSVTAQQREELSDTSAVYWDLSQLAGWMDILVGHHSTKNFWRAAELAAHRYLVEEGDVSLLIDLITLWEKLSPTKKLHWANVPSHPKDLKM